MAKGSQWDYRVLEGANALLAYSQEELLAILKRALPDRLEVLQEVVDWAVPDLVYGSARGLLDARYTGTVKSVSEKNGYGFITAPSITEAFGADLFVHYAQLRGLGPGTEVNFAILLNKGKPHGYDVVANDAAPTNAGAGLGSWPPPAALGTAPATQWKGKGGDRGTIFADAGWGAPKGSAKGSLSVGWSAAQGSGKDAWATKGATGAHTKAGAVAKGAWTAAPTGGAAGKTGLAAGAVGKGSIAAWNSNVASSAHQAGKQQSSSKGAHQDASGKGAAAGKGGSGGGGGGGYAFSSEVPTSAVELPGVTDRRFSGFVKSAKEEKFGFLTCAELQAIHSEQDIYVHWNHVKEFQIGDAVTFAVLLNEKGGLKAVDLLPGNGDGQPANKRPRQW